MKTIEYTVKKTILNPEEKVIAKSWGTNWQKIMTANSKQGYFYLVIGTWSGYSSSQRKVAHVDVVSNLPMYFKAIKNEESTGYLGTIEYSDNTTLEVIVKRYTLQQLFSENLLRKPSYTELIRKLVDSPDNYYKV